MTDKQENKFSMYLASEDILDANNATWAGTPAFVSAKTLYSDVILRIGKARQVQEKETKGVTEDKAQAREAAITKGITIAAATFAFASVTSNNTLKEQVNYSPSDLRLSRDTILVDRLRVIHNAANDYAADLVDFGVQAADLSDLDTLINKYADQVQNPRTAIGERSTATQELEALFVEGDTVLKEQLDKLIEIFKVSAPNFYNQYKSARVIVDLGRGGSSDPDEPEPEPLVES